MANPVRETIIRVELYTREITYTPDETIVLYHGDRRANKFIFTLYNQGEPVDTAGYKVLLRYTRPDETVVMDEILPDGDGALACVLPGAVYVQIGAVKLNCTIIDDQQTATAFEMPLRVREKAGICQYEGVDEGNALPSYEQILSLIRQMETAIGIASGDEGEGLDARLRAMEEYLNRPEGFATREQGEKADAYTPETATEILDKLLTVDGEGSGLDADLLAGHPSDYFLSKPTAHSILLRASAWVDMKQTVPVEGLTGDPLQSIAWVSSAEETKAEYVRSGTDATSQEDGALVFSCASRPQKNLLVNVAVSALHGVPQQHEDYELYGLRIDKNDPNPDTRCTYLYDAVGKRPARMDYATATFDYGDWADVGFVRDNRPVMLRYDGIVDYALNPADVSKRADGAASDIANTAYAGNAMAEMPLWWTHQYEDEEYEYLLICNKQHSPSFHASAFTRGDGSIAPCFYLPMYESLGFDTSGRLRSLSGRAFSGSSFNAITLSNAAALNGACWDTMTWSRWDYTTTLLCLLACSTDTQKHFGGGYGTSGTPAITGYQLNTRGRFYGSSGYASPMKAFYSENLWGNMPTYLAGIVIKADRQFAVRLTPPYNILGDGYDETGAVLGVGGSKYVDRLYVSAYGKLPISTSGSSATYYADVATTSVAGSLCGCFAGRLRSHTTESGAFSLFMEYAPATYAAAVNGCVTALPPAEEYAEVPPVNIG